MHIHSAPDVLDRSGDGLDFAKMALEAKMKGFIIKCHYTSTAGGAYYARKMVPEVNALGSVCLNNSMGGLNPSAVDIAGRMGAKLVWMPTVDSMNESLKMSSQDEKKLPFWARMQRELKSEGLLKPPVRISDASGKFLPELDEILDRIRKYKMILATGHLSPQESIKLIKYATENGVKRIIITHPEFPTTYFTIEEQLELAKYPVFLERCYTTPATGKVSWEYVLEGVKRTGPDRNILATDLGQKGSILPAKGLEAFVRFFLKSGFSVEEIRQMTVRNQEQLLR
jgi:hypothetical protein